MRMTIAAVAIFAIAGTGWAFSDDNGGRRFSETLNGLKEATVVVSTTGTGTFEATINRDETEISYVLTFNDLEGDVRQAHIHIGHPQNQGGVVLWLCQTAANPSPTPLTTPQCTQANAADFRNGEVTGTLTAADVQAQTPNGIAAGEFEEVIALIRGGRTYANVHSSKFGPGEIRAQLDNGDDDDDDHGGSGHH